MPEVIPIEGIHLLNQSNSNQLNTNQIKSNQFLVFEERGKPEYPSKNVSEQTQPTYDAESGNRIRATLVEGECSDTAPTLLYRFVTGRDA